MQKIVNYFIPVNDEQTFLIKQKIKSLIIFNLIGIFILFVLIVFTFISHDINTVLTSSLLPFIVIIIIIIDLFFLKFKTYNFASNFLTILVSVAMGLQLIFIKPLFFFDDYVTTYYFIFAIFTLSAIFSSKKIFFINISIILICVAINMFESYQLFPDEYKHKLYTIIPYFFFSLFFTTLLMYIISYLSQQVLSKTEENTIEIKNLNKKLLSQNENLENLVKQRTQKVQIQKEEIQMKNEELLLQNEEIFVQTENLKSTLDLVEEQHEDINASLRYAHSIQKAILPLDEELKKDLNYFLIYKPKDIVSGDFYWYYSVKSSKDINIFLSLADCTGHGVPGAFMSMLGYNLLNEIITSKHYFETKDILEQLDNEVRQSLKQEQTKNHDGMDMAFCRIRINNSKTQLVFSGAKRPIIIYSKKTKSITYIRGDNRSVGGYYTHDIPFTEKKVELEKGDIVYLFTDGITDQNNTNNKKFGTKRLKDLIIKHGNKPLKEQKSLFEKEIISHQDNEDQLDDTSLLCFEI